MSAIGVVSRETRELAETSYKFDAPFVLDSERAARRGSAWPRPRSRPVLKETVDWWRADG